MATRADRDKNYNNLFEVVNSLQKIEKSVTTFNKSAESFIKSSPFQVELDSKFIKSNETLNKSIINTMKNNVFKVEIVNGEASNKVEDKKDFPDSIKTVMCDSDRKFFKDSFKEMTSVLKGLSTNTQDDLRERNSLIEHKKIGNNIKNAISSSALANGISNVVGSIGKGIAGAITGVLASVTGTIVSTLKSAISDLLNRMEARAELGVQRIRDEESALNDIMWEYGLIGESGANTAREYYRRKFRTPHSGYLTPEERQQLMMPYQKRSAYEQREYERDARLSALRMGYNTEQSVTNVTGQLTKWKDIFEDINFESSELFNQTMKFVDKSGKAFDEIMTNVRNLSTNYMVTPELLEEVSSGYSKYMRAITRNSTEYTKSMNNLLQSSAQLENVGVDSRGLISQLMNFQYSDVSNASQNRLWKQMAIVGMNPYSAMTMDPGDLTKSYANNMRNYFKNMGLSTSNANDRRMINTLAQQVFGISPSEMPDFYALLNGDTENAEKELTLTDIGKKLDDYAEKEHIRQESYYDRMGQAFTYITEEQQISNEQILRDLDSIAYRNLRSIENKINDITDGLYNKLPSTMYKIAYLENAARGNSSDLINGTVQVVGSALLQVGTNMLGALNSIFDRAGETLDYIVGGIRVVKTIGETAADIIAAVGALGEGIVAGLAPGGKSFLEAYNEAYDRMNYQHDEYGNTMYDSYGNPVRQRPFGLVGQATDYINSKINNIDSYESLKQQQDLEMKKYYEDSQNVLDNARAQLEGLNGVYEKVQDEGITGVLRDIITGFDNLESIMPKLDYTDHELTQEELDSYANAYNQYINGLKGLAESINGSITAYASDKYGIDLQFGTGSQTTALYDERGFRLNDITDPMGSGISQLYSEEQLKEQGYIIDNNTSAVEENTQAVTDFQKSVNEHSGTGGSIDNLYKLDPFNPGSYRNGVIQGGLYGSSDWLSEIGKDYRNGVKWDKDSSKIINDNTDIVDENTDKVSTLNKTTITSNKNILASNKIMSDELKPEVINLSTKQQDTLDFYNRLFTEDGENGGYTMNAAMPQIFLLIESIISLTEAIGALGEGLASMSHEGSDYEVTQMVANPFSSNGTIFGQVPQNAGTYNPLSKYNVTSMYGDPNRPHRGIDFEVPYGTKLPALESGYVIGTGYLDNYGFYVDLQGKDGYTYRYSHLNSINVRKGQLVSQKDILGISGSSGTSNPHLHLEVVDSSNNYIDPLTHIKSINLDPGSDNVNELLSEVYNNSSSSIKEEIAEQVAQGAVQSSGSNRSQGASQSKVITGNIEVDPANTKLFVYNYLKNKGWDDTHIAGVLGNWSVESNVTAKRFEADYTKMASNRGGFDIFNNIDSMNEYAKAIFNNYAKNGKSINKGVYQASDGNYYVGIGLGQWTGERAKLLIDYANEVGRSPWDLQTQLDFMFEADDTYHRNKLEKYIGTEFKSTDESTSSFLNNWEGVKNDKLSQRQEYATSMMDNDIPVWATEIAALEEKNADPGVLAYTNAAIGEQTALLDGGSVSNVSLSGNSSIKGYRAAVLDFVYQQLGKPYKWGGTGPEGYDCSGLVTAALNNAGLSEKGRITTAMMRGNITKFSSAEGLQPGDFVIGNKGGHAGIYIGDGLVIAASSGSNEVKLQKYDGSFWYGRWDDPPAVYASDVVTSAVTPDQYQAQSVQVASQPLASQPAATTSSSTTSISDYNPSTQIVTSPSVGVKSTTASNTSSVKSQVQRSIPSRNTGITSSTRPTAQLFATGGRITDPTLALMGEAGYNEYVISTDPQFASRSVNLMNQAANELGVSDASLSTSGSTPIYIVSNEDKVVDAIETLIEVVKLGFSGVGSLDTTVSQPSTTTTRKANVISNYT